MEAPDTPTAPAGEPRQHRRGFQPGDLVVPVRGYPLLCEVVTAEADGLVRIRGLQWPPGYSAMARAEDYRLATGRLSH